MKANRLRFDPNSLEPEQPQALHPYVYKCPRCRGVKQALKHNRDKGWRMYCEISDDQDNHLIAEHTPHFDTLGRCEYLAGSPEDARVAWNIWAYGEGSRE